MIHSLRTETAILNQVQRTLSTELLILQDMATNISPNNDTSQIIVYVLAGIAGALGLLCLIILIVYIIRTKR